MDDQELFNEMTKRPRESQEAIIQKLRANRENEEPEDKLLSIGDSDQLDPAEDQLNRYPVAKIIARRIVEDKSISTYSIEGDWGSGKTNVMRWVQKELAEEYKGKVLPVWFDPWKYESLGNIIVPLIKQLETQHAVGKDFDKTLDRVLGAAAILGGTVVASHYVGWKVIGELFSIFSVSRVKKLKEEYEKLSHLCEDFQKLVDYVVDSYQSPPEKIVFLIDDLDRCLPDNVVLLLESIKNFLKTKKACFVFAVDRKIVAQGIKVKYGSNLSEADGDEYLEKIIEYSFDLPFDASGYCQRMRRFYETNTNFPTGNIEFVDELFRIANVKSVRQIKRVLNRFVFLNDLGFQVYQGKFHPQMLLFLVYVYEIFPDFYDFLLEFQRAKDLLIRIKLGRYEEWEKAAVRGDRFLKKLTAISQLTVFKPAVEIFIDKHYGWSGQQPQQQEATTKEVSDQLILCCQICSLHPDPKA